MSSFIFMPQQTLKYSDFKVGLIVSICKISTNGSYFIDPENYSDHPNAK